MRSLSHPYNPRLSLSRLALVGLVVFSLSLMASTCQAQAQEPAAAPAKPTAEPAAKAAPAKPAAGPVKYDELPCKESREKDRSAISKILRNQAPSAKSRTKTGTITTKSTGTGWEPRSRRTCWCTKTRSTRNMASVR